MGATEALGLGKLENGKALICCCLSQFHKVQAGEKQSPKRLNVGCGAVAFLFVCAIVG